jgi:hypothetical protein
MSAASQQTILKFLRGRKLRPRNIHHNPEMGSTYFSSSYIADKGFQTPKGGYGPPQDVNASFCHNHTESSFTELHPDVDLNRYEMRKTQLKVDQQHQTSHSATTTSLEEPTVPAMNVDEERKSSDIGFRKLCAIFDYIGENNVAFSELTRIMNIVFRETDETWEKADISALLNPDSQPMFFTVMFPSSFEVNTEDNGKVIIPMKKTEESPNNTPTELTAPHRFSHSPDPSPLGEQLESPQSSATSSLGKRSRKTDDATETLQRKRTKTTPS